jgi:hypothetical protein
MKIWQTHASRSRAGMATGWRRRATEDNTRWGRGDWPGLPRLGGSGHGPGPADRAAAAR